MFRQQQKTSAAIVRIHAGMCIVVFVSRAFFLGGGGGCRGTCTLKYFVNLTGESKNLKKMFSQTESTPKHFFWKKSTVCKYQNVLTLDYKFQIIGCENVPIFLLVLLVIYLTDWHFK
jgi:hypothetical protein